MYLSITKINDLKDKVPTEFIKEIMKINILKRQIFECPVILSIRIAWFKCTAKLRRLVATLEAEKNFSIQIAGERLLVPKKARVNIEHEREGQWEEIEFQIKWKQEK